MYKNNNIYSIGTDMSIFYFINHRWIIVIVTYIIDVSTFAIAENLNWNKNVSDYQMEILD